MKPHTIFALICGLAPLMALIVSKLLFDAYCRSKQRRQVVTRDEGYNEAYERWRRRLKAVGGVEPVDCPLPLAVGEVCYAHTAPVALYVPATPHGHRMPRETMFDLACGVNVGLGWSITDCFDGVRFLGRGGLSVTNRYLYFTSAGKDQTIPLGDIHTGAAACSGLLVGAAEMDRPLLFSGVNGQRFRDTIHMLLEEDE